MQCGPGSNSTPPRHSKLPKKADPNSSSSLENLKGHIYILYLYTLK